MTQFDVALSFAGEQRDYVSQVANILESNGLSVFYDKFKQSHLWGKDLSVYLHKVFSEKSKFCIMFISKEYIEKAWPIVERKAAFEKQVQVDEYILPVKFDETEIPGLPSTIGYLSAKEYSPEEISKMFLEKFKEGISK